VEIEAMFELIGVIIHAKLKTRTFMSNCHSMKIYQRKSLETIKMYRANAKTKKQKAVVCSELARFERLSYKLLNCNFTTYLKLFERYKLFCDG
jgi:hypothetical protein